VDTFGHLLSAVSQGLNINSNNNNKNNNNNNDNNNNIKKRACASPTE
jgi:hypothetical protein